MDGETPDVRTCSDCYVTRDLENIVGKNLCCERCIGKRKRYRAKSTKKRMRKTSKHIDRNTIKLR